MGRKKSEPNEVFETPLLPPFPSEAFNIVVEFRDGTSETIKTMARGVVSALKTATYTMERWPKERQPEIANMRVHKP